MDGLQQRSVGGVVAQQVYQPLMFHTERTHTLHRKLMSKRETPGGNPHTFMEHQLPTKLSRNKDKSLTRNRKMLSSSSPFVNLKKEIFSKPLYKCSMQSLALSKRNKKQNRQLSTSERKNPFQESTQVYTKSFPLNLLARTSTQENNPVAIKVSLESSAKKKFEELATLEKMKGVQTLKTEHSHSVRRFLEEQQESEQKKMPFFVKKIWRSTAFKVRSDKELPHNGHQESRFSEATHSHMPPLPVRPGKSELSVEEEAKPHLERPHSQRVPEKPKIAIPPVNIFKGGLRKNSMEEDVVLQFLESIPEIVTSEFTLGTSMEGDQRNRVEGKPSVFANNNTGDLELAPAEPKKEEPQRTKEVVEKPKVQRSQQQIITPETKNTPTITQPPPKKAKPQKEEKEVFVDEDDDLESIELEKPKPVTSIPVLPPKPTQAPTSNVPKQKDPTQGDKAAQQQKSKQKAPAHTSKPQVRVDPKDEAAESEIDLDREDALIDSFESHMDLIDLLGEYSIIAKNSYAKVEYSWQVNSFWLYKKFVFERHRVLAALKGGENCFTIEGLTLSTREIKHLQQLPDIQQYLEELQEEEGPITESLTAHHKRACGINNKLRSENDIRVDPRKEVMKCLGEEFHHLDKLSQKQSGNLGIFQRLVYVCELLFMLENLHSNHIKDWEELTESKDVEVFKSYLNKYRGLVEKVIRVY